MSAEFLSSMTACSDIAAIGIEGALDAEEGTEGHELLDVSPAVAMEGCEPEDEEYEAALKEILNVLVNCSFCTRSSDDPNSVPRDRPHTTFVMCRPERVLSLWGGQDRTRHKRFEKLHGDC